MRVPAKSKQLLVLQSTITAIAKAKDERERVQCVFEAFRALGLDLKCRARLAVANKEKTVLRIRHAWGDHGRFDVRNVHYNLGTSPTGDAFKKEHPVPFNVEPSRWRGRFDGLMKFQVQSFLAMPVPRGDAIIGVLSIDSPTRNGFSQQHISLLTPYAALLGGALDVDSDPPQEPNLVTLISRTRERQVLVLGKDTGDEFERLQVICDYLRGRHYDPILVKTHPDIPELSNEEKVRVFADHSRFVVLENSFPAGQIAELKMCSTNRIITATVRETGRGSSFMVTDYFRDFDFIKEFEYADEGESLKSGLASAIEWAERKIKERTEYYNGLYPWRKRRS